MVKETKDNIKAILLIVMVCAVPIASVIWISYEIVPAWKYWERHQICKSEGGDNCKYDVLGAGSIYESCICKGERERWYGFPYPIELEEN